MPDRAHLRQIRPQFLPWIAGSVALAAITAAAETEPGGEAAPEDLSDSAQDSVFAMPRFQPEYQQMEFLINPAIRAGDYERAREAALRALELSPYDAVDHYNLACVQALLGTADAALDNLEKSVSLGFRDERHILADQDLTSLHAQARFWAIAARAGAMTESGAPVPSRTELATIPAAVEKGVARVTEDNTAWDFRMGIFRSFFDFPESASSRPIVAGYSIPRLLLRWWEQWGSAAGNHGDLYDNRDNGHSELAVADFPQLTRVAHSPEARQLGLTMGLQVRHFFNAVTIGNSSTALTEGVYWRSQPRVAYTSPGGAALLHLQYVNNHLYFYPEHNDHDPGQNGQADGGHGDVYPANTPYLIISQGSSGSDQPFLEAVACTLAAFRPEVKEKLRESGALMPAIQMIFRQSNRNLLTPISYMTGAAHPTVFEARNLDVEKMVRKAHAMRADKLPPLVQLRVVEEDASPLGDERLFDTPQAIARVFRSLHLVRRMVVSAESSIAPQGRKLKYHWVVLRGDPHAIRIHPLNDESSVVELLIPWHPRRPIRPGSLLESNRVDIGAFVDNGYHISAPAFVCTNFLDNEKREYDSENRLRVLDYTDESTRQNYVDPLIEGRKNWRDEFRYGEGGELLGWTRMIEKDPGQEHAPEPMDFTPEGKLVAARNPDGEITEVKEVRYVVQQDDTGREKPKVLIAVSSKAKPYPSPSPQTVSGSTGEDRKTEGPEEKKQP